MSSPAISGLIGAVVAGVLVAVVTKKLRNEPGDGTLRYGMTILWVGVGSAALALFAVSAFFIDNDVWTDRGEFIAVVCLLVGFGAAAVYSLGEFFFVRGRYDDQGITLRTPWSGRKIGMWRDLKKVTHNTSMSWYMLEFSSGTVIRLSQFLRGHGAVVDVVKSRGFLGGSGTL
ncbi:MAG: hypothetical protein AAGH76_08980 [Pseudomonadota bacterium]